MAGPALAPLEQLVRELVVEYWDASDWPAGHRCTKDGPTRCTHQARARLSLLDRLTEQVRPGTTATDRQGKRPARVGSPAPWDPRAAELRDEILRGALRKVERARRVLGLVPFEVSVPVSRRRPADRWGYLARLGYGPPSDVLGYDAGLGYADEAMETTWGRRRMPADAAPVEVAGVAALRALPGLEQLLRAHSPEHPLVLGDLVDLSRPDRGRRLGEIASSLRTWHARSLRVAGYESPPPIRWFWIDNPLPDAPSGWWSGPLCPSARRPRLHRRGSLRYERAVTGLLSAAPVTKSALAWHPRWEQVSCGHASCLRAAYDAMGSRAPAWCPWCWHRSIEEDQESGLVRCTSERCPGRPEWGSRAAALDELAAITRAELGVDATGCLTRDEDDDAAGSKG